VTYSELDEQVNDIASALIHIGFTNIDSPLASRPRVSIYADTSLRWQLMAQTFSRLGHVITTAYTTLGEEGLLRSLVEPDVEFILCGEDQVEMVSKVVARAEKVKWVIYDADESRVDKVSSLSKVEADISGVNRYYPKSCGRARWTITPFPRPERYRSFQSYSLRANGPKTDRR
jgi:long-chain acyl-CoA synthetase